MTKKSRTWRDKKLNKIRVINKLHNSILGTITGEMAVIFLLAFCSIDNVNKYVIASYCISFTWLSLVIYLNNMEVGDE